MRTAIKAALFALPFAAAFLVIRLLATGEAERWLERVEPYAPGAVVGVDEDDLIVIAPDVMEAKVAASEVRDFRRALVAHYGDLLGEPRFERMVVVVLPDVASVRAYAGKSARADRGATEQLLGYTDPRHGAIFIAAEAIHTLRHETVHWVMETARGYTSPSYSPWLSEGLAQLFEDFDPAAPDESPALGPGPRAAARTVRPGAGIDVDRLLGLADYGRFVAEDGERNYRDALLLCAFLFARRPEELPEYVDVERRTAMGRPEAFRAKFAHDEEAFARDLRAFLERLRAG